MCALELAVEGDAQQVAFGPHPAGTQLAVATNDAITFFELPPRGHGATQTLRKLSMADMYVPQSLVGEIITHASFFTFFLASRPQARTRP